MVTAIADSIRTLDYEKLNEEEDQVLEADQLIDNNNLLLNYYLVARFEVSKIQTADTMCITRLSSLGNQSLFVGGGVSVAGNFNEFDKNCIYFAEDADYSITNEYPLVSREAGVFYLDDGSLKRSFPSIKTEKRCFMNWFSPNIKIGAFY